MLSIGAVTLAMLLLATACARPDLTAAALDGSGGPLVVRDDVNGLDWLDLSATAGLSVDEVEGGAGGWTDRGFRYATTEEVCRLLARYGQTLAACPAPDRGVRRAGADALIGAIGSSAKSGSVAEVSGFFRTAGGIARLTVAKEGRSVATSLYEAPQSRSLGVPDVGHFLVRRPITIYGRPGSFGRAPTELPSGVRVAHVGIDGFAVDPGQSLYHPAAASDGTLFFANVTQAYNQMLPLACSQVVTCFNPDAPTCRDESTGEPAHFANMRVPNNLGSVSTPPWAGGSACADLSLGEAAGADVSDVLVVGSGADERLLASSMLGSTAPLQLPSEFHPAWCTFRKADAGWELDRSHTHFARDLRALSPPASEQLCRQEREPLCADDRDCPATDGCDFSQPRSWMGKEYGLCRVACTTDAECPSGLACGADGTCVLTDCGGLNELALLPRSGHVVASLYLRFGLAVLDQQGRVLASFEHGDALPNPCRCEEADAASRFSVPVRVVEADPTSVLGDERFAVVYDSFSCGLGQLVQEFRYRAPTSDAPARIEPVTPPFVPHAPSRPPPSCSGERPGQAVVYDDRGHFWAQGGGVFTVDPLVVYLRDPATGRRSLEERCGVVDGQTGEPRPVGMRCRADLDLGAPRSADQATFGHSWSLDLFRHVESSTIFSLGIHAALGTTRSLATDSGAVVYASPRQLPLGAARLPRPPRTRPWAWKAAFGPGEREFFVPIGLQSLDLDVGVVRDNWVYRIGVDTVLEARPQLLAADVPAQVRAGEAVAVSLTVDLTGQPRGTAHALYVTGNGELVRVADWARRCEPELGTCTFTASIPRHVVATRNSELAWHALLHTATGSLHVAGRLVVE